MAEPPPDAPPPPATITYKTGSGSVTASASALRSRSPTRPFLQHTTSAVSAATTTFSDAPGTPTSTTSTTTTTTTGKGTKIKRALMQIPGASAAAARLPNPKKMGIHKGLPKGLKMGRTQAVGAGDGEEAAPHAAGAEPGGGGAGVAMEVSSRKRRGSASRAGNGAGGEGAHGHAHGRRKGVRWRRGTGNGMGTGPGKMVPRPGEQPVVLLRVQVLGCMGLLARDRSGTSDPFVTTSLLPTRHSTPVVKRTLSPVYPPATATFDFPIFLSLADRLGVGALALECVVWDRDLMGMKKDYLGEVGVGVGEWFGFFASADAEADEEVEVGFENEGNKPISLPLISTRSGTAPTGTIQLKLGLVAVPGANNLMELDEIYAELVRRGQNAYAAGRVSLVSAPPVSASHVVIFGRDFGGLTVFFLYLDFFFFISVLFIPRHSCVGTIRSHHTPTVVAGDQSVSVDSHGHLHPHPGPDHGTQPADYQDDGGLSSDSSPEDSEADDTDVTEDEENENENDTGTETGDERVDVEGVRRAAGLRPDSGASGGRRSGSASPLLDLYIPPPIDMSFATGEESADAEPEGKEKEKEKLGRDYGVLSRQAFQGAGVRPPELVLTEASPATPTPGSTMPTAVPLATAKSSAPSTRQRQQDENTPRAASSSSGYGALGSAPARSSASPGALSITPVPTPSSAGPGAPPLTPTTPITPTTSSGASRFIPNPKKFVRRFSGLTGGGGSSASSSSEAQGSSTAGAMAMDAEGAGAPSLAATANPVAAVSQTQSDGSLPSPVSSAKGDGGKGTGKKTRKRKGRGYEFKGDSNDIVGIVMLEIEGADDLPRVANMTRTGWDMDPFVVISFGKKVFRTRVIRHSRNPVWDEKLLFHVRRYETAYKVQLAVLDWDKLSSNDRIGDVTFDIKDLVDSAPQPDPETGLYRDEDSSVPMGKDGGVGKEAGEEKGVRKYSLPLATAKETKWETKHNSVIRFRAKYQPYAALRQRFWRQYLKQYDTDDTATMSHLELTSMLDSLGSTLTRSTLNSFFTRFGVDVHEGEITFDQAVQCLEEELCRPDSEKKRVDADDGLDTSVTATPVMMLADHNGAEVPLDLDQLDFTGPPHVGVDGVGGRLSGGTPAGEDGPGASYLQPRPPKPYKTEPMQMPLVDTGSGTDLSSDDTEGGDIANNSPTPQASTLVFTRSSETTTTASLSAAAPGKKSGGKKMRFKRMKRSSKTGTAKDPSEDSNGSGGDAGGSSSSDPGVERVINVKNCPLCHRPRLNSKAEMDIVTHLAICASQDWSKVDRIVTGNFVTASQAQRKWYTKIISKVSSGDYRLGANSANIIVQNRMTGQLEEEKMQVYVRLGIRLLYKGATSRMEGGRARRLLKSLSIKQGVKYDDPDSAKEIPTFIDFHGLNMDEILDPLESFKTFNQFFYRKLRPSARPVEAPNDPYRLVSAADCRLMTFETVQEATKLWIKGREFTVARLLGDAYKADADRYVGGALAIFRLAPQDYHRFHVPVDGKIGPMTYIAGEYYTVNPQAIRTALDVYGENARKIVPIDSPQFGRVMAVCIGAMMVGSIVTTVEEGEQVKRGQEFGYFAFGGSTIVILFEKGKVTWDEDLLINGRASLETLVRVGMGLGTGIPGV
ncbi:hypothetical protein D9619_006903 [Psilocybe cf. subviscida]|uniref:Phosphatidylserine decarboxylase proenzyme 2 n=1 Tax=Psilocybe cf. subviscida TaxID=2480587 RepID=A0A8H5B3H7_9AGAR|nr:hypothetical protein D9619_006903 [Psilocybe cf. subviscida]